MTVKANIKDYKPVTGNLCEVHRLSLPRCVVIIPAHNESSDISYVISEVQKHTNFPVVVIDDASTDDTVIKARKAGALVIPLAVQLGAWGATGSQ